MADFAPYQDTPELQRTLSPPPTGDRRSTSNSPGARSPALQSPTNNPTTSPWSNIHPVASNHNSNSGFGNDPDPEAGGRSGRLDEFATSLPIRLDYEACLAYLLLPPAGGVFLLLVERKSDYVRFHAWQSSLLFSAMFLLHLVLSWSSFLSWIIFLTDIALIAGLTYKAYIDGMLFSKKWLMVELYERLLT